MSGLGTPHTALPCLAGLGEQPLQRRAQRLPFIEPFGIDLRRRRVEEALLR
jgi:hypothetical protein